MKWKDNGDRGDTEEKSGEEYFDEEQYSPWADHQDRKKGFKLSKPPLLMILLAAAIVALVVVLLMLIGGRGDTTTFQKMASLEDRVLQLEERMDKYESIDEKVTRIWEQAKSFENFKDRFERSEASMSLRMDHLTMSLETLQKQLNEAKKVQNTQAAKQKPDKAETAASQTAIQYHEVAAGDTLYSISKQYNLSVEALLKMNRMEPGTIIQPGQKLIVRPGNAN